MSRRQTDRRGTLGTRSNHRVHAPVVGVALLFVLAIALAATVGCGGETASGTSAGGGGEQTVCVYDSTWPPYTSFDPSKEIWANLYQSQVYDCLTHYDGSADDMVGPELATSWESPDGGKTWTFHLREGVKFHNGETMTSEDVKFSFERALKIGVGTSFFWDALESIEAPDPLTVVFHFSKPRAVPGMVDCVTPPGFIFSKAAFQKDGDKAFAPGTESAGSGPYMPMKALTNEVTLKPFDDYWGGWEGTHAKAPDIAVIRQVAEPSVRIQELQLGEAQIVANIPAANVESIKSDSDVKFISEPWWMIDFININTKSGPTADVKLREALYHAFPYEEVLRLAVGNMGAVATGAIFPGQPSYDLQAEAFGVPKQDMAKAKAALAESKYNGEKLLCVVDQAYDQNMQIVQLFKSSLQPLGINLDVRFQSTDVIYNNIYSENPPQAMYIAEFGSPYVSQADMVAQLFASWSGYNLNYYADPQTDELIEEARQLEAQSAEAAGPKLIEVEKRAMAEYPIIFAVNPDYRVGLAKNITWEGFKAHPGNAWVVPFYNVQMN